MNSPEVIVCGGGPAGATTATLLAKHGHRVLLLERSAEPAFKVGESLMPATWWTFERLGMLAPMRRSRFPVKASVQFFAADGRASTPFYFEDQDPHESSRTWQVLRSEFDQLLLDNAAAHGVAVRRGVAVREVLFESGRAVGVRAGAAAEVPEELSCRVVVDATGQSALLANRLRTRRMDRRLRNASLFTHYEGGRRDSGRDEGATLIFHSPRRDTWWWSIPLPAERVSIGVVGPVDHLVAGREGGPERTFAEELARCPALAERLAGARQVEPVRAIRDFSYRATAVAGEGWVLAGDAFGFIDPIYSTGVFLALKSGEMAADAVHEALAADDPSAARLGRFGPELRAGMEALRRLVDAFYDPAFSFRGFLETHPECHGELVDLLMGNVFRRPVDRLLRALEATTGPVAAGAAH